VNLEILDRANLDLVEGYAFYEAKEPGLGSYFLTNLYSDIESLRLYGGIHSKPHKDYHRLLSKSLFKKSVEGLLLVLVLVLVLGFVGVFWDDNNDSGSQIGLLKHALSDFRSRSFTRPLRTRFPFTRSWIAAKTRPGFVSS
jgi:hypothetical protein